ncbi:LacI family DNA-binding transcriptional regulator [Microbacterium sp. AZCO]|uniref:LacI family DNA-binding transcriptional regulator n=1 Tax=Microbacterium sp. AZCO TaxID=3142976 RepID=UPI0031F45F58
MTDNLADGRKRPSIYDVAALAGVSHMTVSRVLNGAPSIRPDTRERVQAAIEEIRYRPSGPARTLATRRTMRIGALVHSPSEYGPKSTVLSLERAARGAGYAIAAFSHSGAPGEVEEGISQLDEQGVDGLCVIGPPAESPATLGEVAERIPVVVVGSGGSDRLIHVDADQAGGAKLAVEHLLALGHRSILHLAGPLDGAVGAAREAAARRAVEDAGASLRTVLGDWSSASGFEVGADRARVGDATAIFAGNDEMALGVIHGLSTRGLEVPRDVSVVGFDDMPGSAHFMPPLTTVRQDFERIGEAVLGQILLALDDRPARSISLPTELIVRASTSRVAPPV